MEKTEEISENEREQLIRSTVRFLCKPHPGIERVFIKTRPICAPQMKDISNLFPNIKQLFLYRNCKDTVSSYLALLSSVPYTEIARICFDSDLFTAAKTVLRTQSELYFICKPTTLNIKNNAYSNTVEMLAYMWVNYIFVARDAMSRDQTILPVKYEDLVAEKAKTCKVIFEKLGLDIHQLNTVVSAFENDSQRGTVVSRRRIGNTPRRRILASDRIRADGILSSYSLPTMNEDFRIWEI